MKNRLFQKRKETTEETMSKKEFFWDTFAKFATWAISISSLVVSFISLFQDKLLNIIIFAFAFVFLIFGLSFVISYYLTNENYSFIKKEMSYIKGAKESIDLVFRSLSPEKGLYEDFDKYLQEAQEKRNVKVRILCKTEDKNISRIEGARDIYEKRKIDIRFSDRLNGTDFRYLLSDGETFVVSQQKKDKQNVLSRKPCVEFKTKVLAHIVTEEFDNMWNWDSGSTLCYYRYVDENNIQCDETDWKRCNNEKCPYYRLKTPQIEEADITLPNDKDKKNVKKAKTNSSSKKRKRKKKRH